MPRPLLCLALLGALGSLSAAPARAATASFRSAISEVDACNRAQMGLPAKAVIMRTRASTVTTKDGVAFDCRVSWSEQSDAQPSYLPVLF